MSPAVARNSDRDGLAFVAYLAYLSGAAGEGGWELLKNWSARNVATDDDARLAQWIGQWATFEKWVSEAARAASMWRACRATTAAGPGRELMEVLIADGVLPQTVGWSAAEMHLRSRGYVASFVDEFLAYPAMLRGRFVVPDKEWPIARHRLIALPWGDES